MRQLRRTILTARSLRIIIPFLVACNYSFLNPKDLDFPAKKICYLVMYVLLFAVTIYNWNYTESIITYRGWKWRGWRHINIHCAAQWNVIENVCNSPEIEKNRQKLKNTSGVNWEGGKRLEIVVETVSPPAAALNVTYCYFVRVCTQRFEEKKDIFVARTRIALNASHWHSF